MSNAIKYADRGTTIHVELSHKEGKLHCSITDQGIVIDPSDINHLFQPFYRADALHHKELKGSGLGLSIVKKASDLLGIKILVSSMEEEATTFTLIFP